MKQWHISETSLFSQAGFGNCGMLATLGCWQLWNLVRLHTVPDDALVCCDWPEIPNEKHTFPGLVRSDMSSEQLSESAKPVAACLSNRLTKCTSLRNTLLKK